MYGTSNIFSRNRQDTASSNLRNSPGGNQIGGSFYHSSQSERLGTYRLDSYHENDKPTALMTSMNEKWKEFMPSSIGTKDKTIHLSIIELRIEDYFLIHSKRLHERHVKYLDNCIRNGIFNTELFDQPTKLLPFSHEKPIDFVMLQNKSPNERYNSSTPTFNSFDNKNTFNNNNKDSGNKVFGNNYNSHNGFPNSNQSSNNAFNRSNQSSESSSYGIFKNNNQSANTNQSNSFQGGNIFNSGNNKTNSDHIYNNNDNTKMNNSRVAGSNSFNNNIFNNFGGGTQGNHPNNNIFNNANNQSNNNQNDINRSNTSNSPFNNNNNASSNNAPSNNIFNNNGINSLSSKDNNLNCNQNNGPNLFNNQNNVMNASKQNNNLGFNSFQSNSQNPSLFKDSNQFPLADSQGYNQMGYFGNESLEFLTSQAFIFDGIVKQIEKRVIEKLSPFQPQRNQNATSYGSNQLLYNICRQNEREKQPFFNISFAKDREQHQPIKIAVIHKNNKQSQIPAIKHSQYNQKPSQNMSNLPVESRKREDSTFKNIKIDNRLSSNKKCESILVHNFQVGSGCHCSVRFQIKWLDNSKQSSSERLIITKEDLYLPYIDFKSLQGRELLVCALKEVFPIIRSDAKVTFNSGSSFNNPDQVTLAGIIEQRIINLNPYEYEVYYHSIRKGMIFNFTIIKRRKEVKTATISWDAPVHYETLDFSLPDTFNLDLSEVVCNIPALNSKCRITFEELPPRINKLFKEQGKSKATEGLKSFIDSKNEEEKIFELCSIHEDGSWTLIVQKFN